MKYLFDTDTISELFRPSPSIELIRRLATTPAEDQATSSITLGELLYGALRSPERTAVLVERIERRVASNLRILPFDAVAASEYGALRVQLERRGTPIGDADMRIAAIALANDLTVITGNVRHFERVDGLQVENWMA